MRVCDVEGCGRSHEGRGYCNAHYQRFMRTGDAGYAHIHTERPECSVDGCDRPHSAKSYCGAHYRRWKKTGDPGCAQIQPYRGATSYCGVHLKIARERGPAASHDCRHCGEQADDWAYDHTDPSPMERDQYGSPYSTDITRYRPLCRNCHIQFDRTNSKETA